MNAVACVNKQATLSKKETEWLTQLEASIDKGFRDFHQVGSALMEIRDAKLYRRDYDSFDAYCRGRWGFGKSHAYRQIEAAIVAHNVSPHNGTTSPMGDKVSRKVESLPNERQARELAELPADQQREAWESATVDGPTTVSRLADIVARAKACLPPEPEEDDIESLPPDEQVERIQRNEERIMARVTRERSAADRKGRIGQIRSLIARVRKLVEGLGDEGRKLSRSMERFEVLLDEMPEN